MRGKKSTIKKLIIILALIAIFSEGIWGVVLPLLVGFLGVGVFIAAFIVLLIKLIKGSNTDKGYTEVQKNQSVPTKNPYSVNYDKEKVDNYEKQKTAPKPAPTVDVKPEELKPVQPKAKKQYTGDPTIDKMIDEKDEAIEEMHRLNDAIEDEGLSKQIDHLESITKKIVDYIIKHPKKKSEVGKFFDYYLPTTMKLLNTYARMDGAGISGTNIDGTKEKVEDMMSTALAAFDKQYDALFADEALDVSTDITVMENMLKSEGLTGDDITLSL